MDRRILEFIQKNKMFENGDGVIAGVSGGADSMCMLLCLLELRKMYSLKVEVLHVNHGIRGEAADGDECFVKEFCESHGVGFTAIHADVVTMAKEQGLTTEEAGRNLRYAEFAALAHKLGYTKIAVAHNSDDVAETILFNIIRGTGVKGLAGIRPLNVRDDLVIVRPLLETPRSVIEEILAAAGVGYRTDATNLDTEYTRNKLRNVILPMMTSDINAGTVSHLCGLGREAAITQDYIDKQTKECFEAALNEANIFLGDDSCGCTVRFLESLHPVIEGNIIRKLICHLTSSLKDIERVHIEAVAELKGKEASSSADLPYGLRARRGYDRITIARRAGADGNINESLSGSISEGLSGSTGSGQGGGTCESAARYFSTRIIEGEEIAKTKEKINKDKISGEANKLYTKWFDYDKIKDRFDFRFARQGDEMLISMDGRLCHKALSKVFRDARTDIDKRGGIPLVAEGSHVIWVPGVRRDDSYVVTDDTQKILEISYNTAPQ